VTAGPYTLRIVSTARRHLAEDLPAAVAFAAHELTNGPLLHSPRRVGTQLMPPLDDRYSARRGTYRVLYRIDETARTVTVLAVGPRGEIYRPG